MSGYHSEPPGAGAWDDEASEPEGTGLLATTLRRAGILVVVGLGLALLAQTGGEPSGTSTRPAESTGSAERGSPVSANTATLGYNEHVVRPGRDGHYRLRAEANGRDMEFLVDTGATTVVLDVTQAEALGIDADGLAFDGVVLTANGQIPGASTRLGMLQIGTLQLDDVETTVVRAELPMPLLGMSVLGRLGGYEVVDGRLVLRW